MLDDLGNHVQDIHTLEEEMTDAVEQVFDHGKERPHNGDAGNGFYCLEHECIIPDAILCVNPFVLFF
jgi:hypothetical protein